MGTDKHRGTQDRSGNETSPRITPEQALENTRELLQEKHDRDEQPKPWQEGASSPREGAEGYQSHGAAERAQELHEGEMRLQANGGSVGTHDRKNQAKRDKRS